MNYDYIPDISLKKMYSIKDFFINHMQNTVIFSNTTTY